jgi:hypothetical protein
MMNWLQVQFGPLSPRGTVSVHQYPQGRKSNDRLFESENLCVGFDDCSPRSPTCTDKIKYLSIVLVQLIFLIFIHLPSNSPFLQGQAILAPHGRRHAANCPNKDHDCGKTWTDPDPDISILLVKFRPFCDGNQIIFVGNHLESCVIGV